MRYLGRYWAAALSVAAHGVALALLLTEFTPQRLDRPPPEQVIEMAAPIPMTAAAEVPPEEAPPPAAEPLRETMVQPPPPDAPPPPPPETPPPPPETVPPPPPVQQVLAQPDEVPVEQPPQPEVAEIQEVAPVSDVPVEVAVSAPEPPPPPRPKPPPPPVRRVVQPSPPPPTPVPPVVEEVPRPVQRPPAAPVAVAPPRPPAPAGPPPDYLASLVARLERNKVYPRSAQMRRQQGTAVVRFTIARDGRVLSYRIERSSGFELLDSEVEAMIRRSSPLPAMPDTMAEAQLELTIPVRFGLQ